ncbi:ornithine cyclodeaminase family protein [Oceanicaulis sp. LC35]|uniref:ornithine cyclodeaminase family protein n=1 Tax=Oceanicaulis sp. LC35 TaxID=3349635 RepID=UPI003F86551C
MTTAPLFLDAETVALRLDYSACMDVLRPAMIALSSGAENPLLRSFMALGEGRTFALMPGSLGEGQGFGAKLVSVFQTEQGKTHNGLVILFDPDTGAPVCVADGGEVTRIRTAAMSALATDVLARPDTRHLAILGAGVQARAHAEALMAVRDFEAISLWARNADQAREEAQTLEAVAGVPVRVFSVAQEAVSGADVICTVTGACDPVLSGDWVKPGAHVNLVGSSGPMAAETDAALLNISTVFPDHRPHVLAHGGEVLRAIEAGVFSADQLGPEIGQVLAGEQPGRQSDQDITVYKSLGHAVQDLSAVAWLYKTHGEN